MEEVLGVVDYDVWVIDDLDDVMILRYVKCFVVYFKCLECKY